MSINVKSIITNASFGALIALIIILILLTLAIFMAFFGRNLIDLLHWRKAWNDYYKTK